MSDHLGSVVQGTSVEIGEDGQELGMSCQLDKVRKVYKLGSADGGARPTNGNNGVGGNHQNNITDEKKHIESLVLGIMALKGS